MPLQGGNDPPVRAAAEFLGGRARVNRDGVDPARLGDRAESEGLPAGTVPAASDLDRERNGDRAADGPQQRLGVPLELAQRRRVVEVQAPGGVREFEIIDVRYE